MSDSGYVFSKRLSLDRPSSVSQDSSSEQEKEVQDDVLELLLTPKNESLEPFMGELPNLSFVQGLAATDPEFEPTFIAILKKEFTVDCIKYFEHMQSSEPRAAAEIVHKLKYALGYLSMNMAFSFAELYEEKLHIGNIKSHSRFKKILTTVNTFLNRYEKNCH